MQTLTESLTRKKYVSFDSSPLPRVLTLIDLTLLGIGSTVGVGFYIIAGEVARNTAGPAVIISFLIAGIASVFSGICYAEFGSRVPKAGSAYVYSYVCVGEFVAYVIGWNLILEYVIGTASVARGYSAYIDDLANNTMSEAFDNSMHMNVDALSPYPDFFALGITLLLTIVLAVGVKESSRFNNVFTGVNIFVIVYVIISGSTQADIYNWKLTEEDVNNITICSEPKTLSDEVESPWGTGGFAPYGFSGIMQGAATCFFGFVGFDIIATTGEEALRPERNIPLSISVSLFVIFLAYVGMSTVLTLALPYCMQDPDAPLIELYDSKDMIVSKWIVSVGAIFGFSASLLGAMFPMPRVIYAMADDGLLFRFLSRIDKRFKTPVIATIISGIFAGTMALLFSLDALIDMMSIGTLMAYTIVSVCVMLLRYTPDSDTDFHASDKEKASLKASKSTPLYYSYKDYANQLLNTRRLREPTQLTSSLVNYATISFCLFCFLFALFLMLYGADLSNGDGGAIALVTVFFVITVLNLMVIARQPTSSKELSFKVPFVPWLPGVSAFINLYLMCNLTTATWIRFGVWMAVGLGIYFLYGIRNSSGSAIPAPIILYEGLDNLALDTKKTKDGFDVPSICVQPPSPWGSRLESPTSKVRPPVPRRISIIESPLVQKQPDENIFSFVAVVENNEPVSEANSQSFDISPKKSEPVVDFSDSDSDGEKNHVNEVITTATVYATQNCKDTHDDTREKAFSAETSKPQLEEAESENRDKKVCIITDDFPSVSTEIGENALKKQDEIKYKIDSGEISLQQKDNDKEYIINIKSVSETNDEKLNLDLKQGDNQIQEVFHAGLKMEDESKEVVDPQELRMTNSSPLLLSEEELQPPSPAMLRSVSVSSSEPGSPRIKHRHPDKHFGRASSFDNIPPSSLDSPFARRVKNFVIIPVQVPQKREEGKISSTDEEGDKALGTTDSSPDDLPLESVTKSNSNLASDLKSRLIKLNTHNQQHEIASTDDSHGSEAEPSSDSLTLGTLDPIRERGESNVKPEDVLEVNKKISNSTTDHVIQNGTDASSSNDTQSNLNSVIDNVIKKSEMVS